MPDRAAPDERAARPATERILRATVERILHSGVAHLSMQDVATEAGVSKGLIHYHFRDKNALLTRAIEWTVAGLVAREREALEDVPSHSAVESLWQWLEAELDAGHLRVLIELAQDPNAEIHAALASAARARRAAAALSIDALFRRLSLRSRIPVPLLADVSVAFMDGLAMHAMAAPDANLRVSFDVFWLAMLNMAE